MFKVDNEDIHDLPVAFASNVMYILAKNGLSQTEES